MTPLFPLWQRPTGALAREMIASGVDARIVAVDLKKLPSHFAGRRFDQTLLDDLPAGIDPCGENGEFHTFVAAGPMLTRAVAVTPGETVERDGMAYADLASGHYRAGTSCSLSQSTIVLAISSGCWPGVRPMWWPSG